MILLRPNRSTNEPARIDAANPASELMLIRLVTAAMGRLSRSLAKMVRKGQTMVVPVDEMIRPSSINQNWGGYFLTIRGSLAYGMEIGKAASQVKPCGAKRGSYVFMSKYNVTDAGIWAYSTR